jgi:putative membrane protein
VWHHGYGWGAVDGWGWWLWPHGPLFWLVIVLVIAVVVWFLRTPATRSDPPTQAERRSRGLDVLEERYARDEIGRDEYLQKRRDIVA